MRIKKEELEEIRIKFYAQVQDEYDYFRAEQMNGGINKTYENSLQITFYKEVYRYLMDERLPDDDYIELLGEPIIKRLWEVFAVSEIPRQSKDYLRQLMKLYRENEQAGRRAA